MESRTERKTFLMGYWIAMHRTQLHIAHIVCWCVLNTIVWGVVITHTVKWITHIEQHNQILASFTQVDVQWSERVAPKPIVVARVFATRYDEKTIDIFAELSNPNAIWAAREVQYSVLMNGNDVETDTISLAPLQQRYITRLRIPFTGDGLPAVKVSLADAQWKKMADAARVLPSQEWAFVPGNFREISGDAAEVFGTELSFSVVNQSVFGFRQVKAVLAMMDTSGKPVAINSVIIDRILTQESRPVILRWPASLNRSLKPQLFIDLDLLDDEKIISTLE